MTSARSGATTAGTFEVTHARVVVPLDGSEFAESAIATAVELAGADGEIVLATVVEPPDDVVRDEAGRIRVYLDQQEEALGRDAREYLHVTAAQITQTHPGPRVSVEVRMGDPAAGIIAAATDRGADLVVMASHGRTGIPRAVFGSVAGAVLRDGFTPVLVVHPRTSDVAAALPR